MLNFLNQFLAAPNKSSKREICKQYQGQVWKLSKKGIAVGKQYSGQKFIVTDLPLDDFGTIQVASESSLPSNFRSVTYIKVEPPRTLADFDDCECPLFYYGD